MSESTKERYERLSWEPLRELDREDLVFCIEYELNHNNLTDLADLTTEFDRRYGTRLRENLADANNALMRLEEELKNSAKEWS
jgi:hypothetical protein